MNGEFIMPMRAKSIEMTKKQQTILEKLSKGTHTELNLKIRASIILIAYDGMSNTDIATKYEINRRTVQIWRERWSTSFTETVLIETEQPQNLKKQVRFVLGDNYRSGRKSLFTQEQKAKIISLSLQTPDSVGVPISNWTSSSLARKSIELKIVEKISARQVGRFLKTMDIKVHQYKGWLNSKDKIEHPEEFEEEVDEICYVYTESKNLEKKGFKIVATDEKTGIQAIEHAHCVLPVRPGQVEKYEQEYKRHGTSGLIASRNILTGEIIAPLIRPTRTELDFVEHIRNVIALDSKSEYILIMDQLNTHKSESFVKFIAEQCGIDKETLGIKGEKGILKSMETRKAFLSDKTHRIRVVYTPRHCSWLNQIEIWFSILTRQLLNRRYSFKSVTELEEKIAQYIEYYNKHLAKPFKWTYAGKLLQA